MACSVKSISKEELIKVYSYVNGFLMEEMKSGKPYDMEMLRNRALRLYNTILSMMQGSETARVSAANYASTIPDVVLDAIHSYYDPKSGEKTLLNYAMNSVFPWAEAYSMVKKINDFPPKERVNYIEAWLGVGSSSAEDINDAQQASDEIDLQTKKQEGGNAATTGATGSTIVTEEINIKTLQSEGADFAAVPPTVMKSSGNEKEFNVEQKDMNPKKVFYWKVIRFLLDMVSRTPGNDSRNSVTDGASGIHVMFISPRQAEKLGLLNYTIDTATDYYAVPVSSTGDILYFEPVNGQNVSGPEQGSPIAFAIPRIAYDKATDTYYFAGKESPEKWLDKTIRSYARYNGISTDNLEEARMAIRNQMAYSYAISQRLMQNREDMSIMGFINGGGRGYMAHDAGLRTTLSSINFKDGPQSYTIEVDTLNAMGKGKGVPYLYTNDVGKNKPLRIWVPKVDDDIIEKVVTLFTTPILNTFSNAPISSKQRRDLIDQFIDRRAISNKVIMNWNEDGLPEFSLRIDGKKVDLSTQENINTVKEMLRQILRNNVYMQVSNVLTSRRGYDPVIMEETTGVTMRYTPSIANYYVFLEQKGVWINYATDANKNLALYNAYVSFGIDLGMMNELAPFMTPVEKQKPVVEQREMKNEYKGKLMYGTPGIGKTTAVAMNENLVDMDDILVEEIAKVKGQTVFGVPYSNVTNETVGLFMESLFITNRDEAELIYEDVYDKAMAIIKNKDKSVFTGSHRFAAVADILLLNDSIEDLSVTLLDKGKDIGTGMINAVNTILTSQQEARSMENKTVVEMAGKFASDVLFEETPAAPMSDIEAKKADIERRRKEELKVWREKYSEFFEKAGKESTNPEQNQKDIAGLEADYQKYVDDTNAKYDVELARELYKEMKAGKLVTDMTPAEQQVADNYITEELRKSVDAELAALGAAPAAAAPFTEGNEEALKMLEELGEANFNKIMANHPEFGTYDTKDVDEFIAEPTDDVYWNIKNEALIEYLNSEDITYQRIKNMLAKQDAYGQSGIELFDEDYNHVRSITLRELMDLIMDDIAQVKPELVYKNLQQIPFTYDMPDSTIPPVKEGLDPSMFDSEEMYKLATQKAGEIKATPEQIKAAEEWYNNSPLKKYIPFQVVFKAINSNPGAIAQWTRDGIILTKRADFTDYYHEAFHAFIHTFMTKEQRDELFAATRSLPGTFTDYNGDKVSFEMATVKQLEEFLAEGFRNYMLNPSKHEFNSKKEKSIFEWLLNVLRILFEDVTWDMITRENVDSSTYIYELYENLRVGNLTGYSFQTQNTVFDRTSNGMVALDETDPVSKLNWGSTYEILRSMDSLISEYGDVYSLLKKGLLDIPTLNAFNAIRDRKYSPLNINKTFTKEEELLWQRVNKMMIAQREQEGGFSIGVLRNKKMRSNFYSYIRARFIDKINYLNSVLPLIKEGTQLNADIRNNIDTLQWAVRNFGDKDFLESNVVTDRFGNIRGVIGYHMMNTELFERSDKEAFIANIDMNEDDIYVAMAESGRIFDEGGNTMSILERADADILYLLNSLYEPTENTAVTFVPKVNQLGFAELMPFDRVWNNIVRLLENMDDRIVMYNAIKAEIQNFPAYGQLLSKLGTPQIGKEIRPQQEGVAPVYEQSTNFNMKSFTIWNKMLQTFDNVHIPLVQTTIHEIYDIIDGVKATKATYTVTAGTASAVYKRVGERWESEFQEMTPSITNYLGRTAENNNILLVGKAYAYPKLVLTSSPDLYIEFLNKIGINISDSQSVKSAIKFNDKIKKDIIAIQDKVRKIAEYNANEANKDKIIITSINSLINVEKADIGAVKSGIYKLSSVYTRLQELESRYSDYHSNFMVTNAEAEQQYEHTLQSTITRIVKALNDSVKYPTFKTILENPRMKYLDPRNNYFSEISSTLNSLFILQDDAGRPLPMSDPSYGRRRIYPKTNEFVKIEVNNLSGIALMSEDQWKSGIANASSDSISKILSEIHNFAHIQTMEVMRHSDKKFSYVVGTDYVYANGRFDRTYVNVMEFIPGGMGMVHATNIIKQHLSAELKRVNKFRSVDEKGLVYDFKYLDRGKELVIFKDMPVELENKLLALSPEKSLLEHMAENTDLDQDVTKYLRDWLGILSNSLYKKLSGNSFFSIPYPPMVTPKVMIDAFIANNVIHNLESLVLIYGDPAMYAIEKEEFHKRNSGAGGTGKISATDQSAINFVNSGFFNKDGWAEARLGKSKINTRLFDGTLDTAVLKDPVIRSAYYDSIAEYKRKVLKKRDKSDQEIDEILYGKKGTHEKPTGGEMKPYAEMKIADAQGYITFDAYRMMRALQGRWSDIQETYYQRIIKGQEISQDSLLEIFPPEKYQYWGQLQIEANMPGVIAMHKFALIPLIPTMIGENTTLTMLHDKMMREGVHYATFSSGSKIGTLTTERKQDRIYSDDQNMTIAPDFETKTFTKNTIFVDYLKVQVEIAPEFKNEIALSSQLRKIIEDGYMEGGVPTDFRPDVKDVNERITLWNNLEEQQKLDESAKYREILAYETDLNELFEAKKAELIEEMGIELDENGKIKEGFENFINFVKRELNRREIGNHTINMIGVNEKGELKMPLDLSLEADTIERILNNIISKRLVKFKVKGEHLIQVSNALFENRTSDRFKSGFKTADPEMLEKYGSVDLPYYRVVEINGKEVVKLAKAKIAIHGDFYNLFYLNDKEGKEIAVYQTVTFNGKKKRVINKAASLAKLNALLKDEEWLDMEDHRKMITIAGPRIPVQGLNSAEAFEIYEFLPEETGPIIIPPAEIVAKSGSDFDKDTLFMMTPHIYRINGKVKLMDSRVKTKFTKEQLTEKIRSLKDERSRLYKEIYAKDSAFADLRNRLSAEEIDAYELLKKDYIERKNELEGEISIMKSTLLRNAKGKVRLTSAESIKMDERLYNAYVQLDILESSFKKNRALYIGVFKEEAIEPLNKEIEKLMEELLSLSSKSKENAVLQRWVSMVTNPDNFDSLTKPNDTNIVKPIADDLSKFNDVVDGKTWLFRDDTDGIAATRILEIEYNMYKHESNNVGKQVLGIGAVDNTYNILLNRMGAYMNPYMASGLSQKRAKELYDKVVSGQPLTNNEKLEYEKANVFKQTIYLKHNTLDKFGDKAISMSHIYDVDNKNKIGDVISQLINGWVDVAKDAWVFNLQGNKELAPTLLFMVQAGVPFEQAAYFISQPIIKEYVKQQRLAKTAFGRPMGLSPEQPNMFRNKARATILTDIKYGFVNNPAINMNVDVIKNVYKQKFPILRLAASFVPKFLKENNNEFGLEQLKEGVGKKLNQIDDFQRAVFLHFLELEEMSKAMTKLKMATNVDTAKTGTLYSAISKLIKLGEVESDPRLPGKEMVANLKKNSPIASFFIQDFQLDRAEDLFPIRASKSTIAFIMKNAGKLKGDLKMTFGESDEEGFWQSFRNNMVSFIFQGTLYKFDPRELTVYRGSKVSSDFSLAKVPALYQRVVIKQKDGKSTMYMDIKGIEQDFDSGAYYEGKLKPTEDAKVPFAALDRNTFDELSSILVDRGADIEMLDELEDPIGKKSADIIKERETPEERLFRIQQAKRNQYVKFVMEREITRSQIPLSKAKEMFEYNIILRFLDPKIIINRDLVAYEEFLKNRALDNIFSPYKMFMTSTYNYAQMFFHIKNEFPMLAQKFRIFDALSMDGERSKMSRNIRNLRLRNTRLTKNQINLYKENLSELADPSVKKVDNPQDNAFISRFFAMMPFYGYIQAGLNANGRYSLNKILPPEEFATFMTSLVFEYGNYLDRDNTNLGFYELYYPAFVNAESSSGKRYSGGSRVKVYGTPISLDYLSRLDKRPTDYVRRALAEAGFAEDFMISAELNQKAPLHVTEWGIKVYRPQITTRDFSTTTVSSLVEYYKWLSNNVKHDPSKGPTVFVHNKLFNPQDVTMVTVLGDWFFDHPNSKVSNKLGIPLMEYDMKTRKLVTFTDTIVNGVAYPNEKLKVAIDNAIEELVKIRDRHDIIFNANGYGLDLQVSAPVTYLYLSEALAKNFGYVNPGAKSSPNSVKVIQGLETFYQQEMTYEEAAQLYQKCLS